MPGELRSGGPVRVIEYVCPDSGIAAAYAGWLFAQMGAEVTRLARPAAPARTTPEQLALETLAAGKGELACPASPDALIDVLASYDIVLCDACADLVSFAGPLERLHARVPRLTLGIAGIFGIDGPYAQHQATGLDAQGLSGIAWALGESERPPLVFPPGVLEHQSGALLAAGCLLSHMLREQSGTGRIVDIALADILASYVAGNCRFFIHHGLEWHRSGRRASGSGGAYPFVILPCRDGEVCICGRTRAEWERLVAAMGNPEWAAQPRYRSLRAMGQEYPEEVDRLLIPWLSEHTKNELAAVALENNLIVSPIRELSEVLATPGFNERGFFTDCEAAGQALRAPGLPFRVTSGRAPSAANNAGQLLSTSPRAPRKLAQTDGNGAGPLSGLRVLDLGWVWSAPWVSTFLAELGAQVIKVENRDRPDNLRLAGRIVRDGVVLEGPSREMSPMFHQVNHGKLGITLNLKAPRARALLERLVAKSDIVIENMSPGSLERNELGYELFRRVNPGLVMLSMSAAGQFGSLSGMRAYAPTMSSFVGLEALVGYPGEGPMGALNVGLSDPSAAVHALVPLLAALRRARATGQGAYVDLSQTEALLGTLRPYLLAAQLDSAQPPTQGSRHPGMAPHGIYPARGSDEWLTLAVPSDAQWRALARLAHDTTWAAEPRYETIEGRLTNVAELDRDVARWTSTHARDELVTKLRAAGLPSSPVLSIAELWDDPHYGARQMKTRVDIPHYGPEDLFRAPWRFSDFEPAVTRCGPTTGEHNALVFGELLGLSEAEIADLEAQGILA